MPNVGLIRPVLGKTGILRNGGQIQRNDCSLLEIPPLSEKDFQNKFVKLPFLVSSNYLLSPDYISCCCFLWLLSYQVSANNETNVS